MLPEQNLPAGTTHGDLPHVYALPLISHHGQEGAAAVTTSSDTTPGAKNRNPMDL
ncbi:hypothetical protein [Brenneria roseae]|uniref:hypothetical protein n=1 Tax=Brenneria roseae TaxID=1509241 RepID=UPI0014746686|nr:hypothetical protein [Brenneria roseae]